MEDIKQGKTIALANGKKCFIRKVEVESDTEFWGSYKKHEIHVVIDRDRRGSWIVEVTAPDGCYAVDGCYDCETIDEAIAYAITGAMLEPNDK